MEVTSLLLYIKYSKNMGKVYKMTSKKYDKKLHMMGLLTRKRAEKCGFWGMIDDISSFVVDNLRK